MPLSVPHHADVYHHTSEPKYISEGMPNIDSTIDNFELFFECGRIEKNDHSNEKYPPSFIVQKSLHRLEPSSCRVLDLTKEGAKLTVMHLFIINHQVQSRDVLVQKSRKLVMNR